MKFFRSKTYHYLLGLTLAVTVFISFETPVGGSFRDVAILSMADVTDITPVRAQLVKSADASGKALAKDFTGTERQIDVPKDFAIKEGENFVAEFNYRPADSTYTLAKLIRVDPAMVFPLIQGLGELGRNILFHVPMSFVATVLFFIGTIYSILLLRKRNMAYDLQARAYSAIGLLYTLLATITGSIWAKFSWGTFWNFDPRESSILVLLLIYIAYFLLRSLLEEGEEKKARIAAVYNIIAFVTVPFLMFVLPRITQSLHPGGGDSVAPVINLSGKAYIDPTLKIVMWANVTLFLLISIWIKEIYVRIFRLEEKQEV
jgi:heme exporter protein C